MAKDYTFASGLDVFVDGVSINNAFAFNVAEGWVDCYCTSPSKYANNDCGANDILSSRLYGLVEVAKRSDVGIGSLKLDVDSKGIGNAADALERLATAAERVNKALRGPVEYTQVGEVFNIKFSGEE